MTSHVHIALKAGKHRVGAAKGLSVAYSVAASHDPDMSNEGCFDKGGLHEVVTWPVAIRISELHSHPTAGSLAHRDISAKP
jgi:hypothetical protein